MKFSLFLIFCLSLNLSASIYSQNAKVSISVTDGTLIDIFKEIEKQSDFRIFYKVNLINLEKKYTIETNGKPINKLLSEVLEGSGTSFDVVDKVIVITPKELNVVQEHKITGVVTDIMTKEPLPGVSVAVEGTSNGTITDLDGKYTLTVSDQQSVALIFSFIGYITEKTAIEGRSEINVAMAQDIKALEEVVVVGYGTQKKVNLTGAVSAVKVDETITSRSLTNVSSAMSGLVPGLAVTQSTGMAGKDQSSLLIRGLGTVNNANPLIVVDGMPDVDINRLNMNDIESISVLKDATSSAVYGSRAANGVILITTKSGKGQNKTKINFSASYALENPTKAYNFMADYPRALTLEQRLSSVDNYPNQYFQNGTIDQWMALGKIDPLRYPNTDWWKIIMRDGQVQNYNLSAIGGNEKSNFFISVGVMDQKGLQINNDFTRYNGRFNYDYKVLSNMNIGAKFDGNWSKNTYALADGYTDDDAANFDLQYSVAGITPYDPISGYYGGTMAYGEDAQAYNPYTIFVNNLNYVNRQEINPSVYWDWSPVKGLTARLDYALKYYNQFRWNANIPNQAYNFQAGAFGTRVYVGDNAGVGNYTNAGYKTLLNGRLNYQLTIGKNHNLSAMVVYSEEYWYDRYQASARTDRLNPTLHELDGALSNIYQSASGYSNTEGLRSYIGRLNYTAFDKYLLEINCRYDGSSKFLSGHRYGVFPSAALGWRFNEESFIKNLTQAWLTNGKLRVSYGTLGNNSGVSRYEQQETLTANPYVIDGTVVKGLVNTKMVNDELTWESTSVMNIGLDLGFFNGRLSAEIDYYDRLTTGMNRPSDLSILLQGAYDPPPRKNIGNLRNRGIEGNFTWREKKGQFEYSINANIAYNRTNLEKWNEFLDKGYVYLEMPYHFVYTYKDAGIAQTWQDIYNATPQGASPGDILRKDINGDGRIDGNDRVAYSNTQQDRPTTNFALNGYLAWKGFDLSFLLQGATGRKDFWLNNYNNIAFSRQRYASTWDHWNNPWSVENRDGSWPRLGGSNDRVNTTFWLDDLTYLRVKNLQLGYTLPAKWFRRLHVSNIRIYGSAENLATLTNFRGLDPEAQGNKSNAYPLNKSFSFGINIGIQ